jgi:hypothetical protein
MSERPSDRSSCTSAPTTSPTNNIVGITQPPKHGTPRSNAKELRGIPSTARTVPGRSSYGLRWCTRPRSSDARAVRSVHAWHDRRPRHRSHLLQGGLIGMARRTLRARTGSRPRRGPQHQRSSPVLGDGGRP